MLATPTPASGLCEECYLSTGKTELTTGNAQPVSVSVPVGPTVSFYDSPQKTVSVETGTPQPVAVPSRAQRLSAAGWLDVEPLGSGGMGVLYVGYDPRLKLQVVAKFIHSHELRDSTRDRFEVEATALARLTHDNIARLYEYVDGADPYLVLEFVPGGSLADRIRRTPPLTCAEAAEFLRDVARGVAAAHAAGLIHRDLKPGNVLLGTRDGKPSAKVTDFGMAKDVTALESLTVGEAVIGTPEYMSPEQAASQSSHCTARSDVWGLAATLYAAVTGRPPYTRNVRKPPVLTQPLTPPEVERPDLPADLAAVIKKGLEKHPNDRYQTAAEFADDLDRFLRGEPVLARPRAWPVRAWRRVQRLPKVTTIAVACALMAVAALGAIVFDREPTAEEKLARKFRNPQVGKPIPLVGETGLPVWYHVNGFANVATSDEAGGSMTVHAVSSADVVLARSLPFTSYTLVAEVKDIVGITQRSPRDDPTHQFGVAFGLTDAPTPDGLVVASGLRVTLHDFAAGRPQRDTAAQVFQCLSVAGTDGTVLDGIDHGIGSHKFRPSRDLGKPGVWRTLRFEVTPGRVDYFWSEPDGSAVNYVIHRADYLNRVLREDAEKIQLRAGVTITPPRWTPDGGLAVICDQATVGVRNVTVTPR